MSIAIESKSSLIIRIISYESEKKGIMILFMKCRNLSWTERSRIASTPNTEQLCAKNQQPGYEFSRGGSGTKT